MTDRHDGGPAFPRNGQSYFDTKDGMTLLDWFAGQALAGLASNDDNAAAPSFIADEAYIIAEAMLVARSEGKS